MSEGMWIEESPTHSLENGSRTGQHSGVRLPHNFRWLDGEDRPLTEWVPCTVCDDLQKEDPEFMVYASGLVGKVKV